jgi:uncharacterized membrane protein
MSIDLPEFHCHLAAVPVSQTWRSWSRGTSAAETGPFTAMETKTRSLLKSVSYRVFASIVTAVLIFSFTGKLLLAVGLGVLDSVVKILVFFLHERAWMAIPFGRIKHPLEEIPVRKTLTAEDKQAIKSKLDEMGFLGENI